MWGLLHSQSRDGVRQWVAEDGLGSVRMMTDVSAITAETRNYAPYGSVLSQSGTSQTVYGFAGEQIDPSGLSYNRARYYNPAMGTFTALDPFEGYLDLPMSLNGYGYVHGNPTNLVDPTGEFPQILLGALAGLALGAIVGGVQGAIMYQMSISGQCGCANQMEAARMGQGAFITQSAAVGAALGTVMGLATTIPGGGLLLAAMNIADKVEIAIKLASVVEDFRDNGQIDNWCPVAELVFDFFTERVTNTLATDAPTRRNPIDMSPDATSPSRINRPTDTTMPKRCSFSADTRIETADGEKSIADIQVGDLIAGYNPHDESVDLFQVTATFAQQHTHTLNITADGETIHTTDEHPFLNADGVWVNAQDLQVGDEVVSADGDVGIVEAIERIDEPQMMYNLSVAVVATYLVGDGKWVVHNVDLQFDENGLVTGISGTIPRSGLALPRALNLQELINLYSILGVELGLGQEIYLPNGQGGQWTLYSGEINQIYIPPTSNRSIPQQSVAHLHPSGTQIPSAQDIKNLTTRFDSFVATYSGISRLQNRSFIVPLSHTDRGISGRSIPYYPNTEVNDYFPSGKHSEYYHSGSLDYRTGCLV
jgi:RHS repeat-associated protein